MKQTLLRITHKNDNGLLLLTTEDDIANTRADRRTHVELRDEDGNIIGIHVQTLGNSSLAMSYEAKYGTGLINLRDLLFAEKTPYDGTYVKVSKQTLEKGRRDRRKVPRLFVDSDGMNSACNSSFERRGGVKIVFGEIVAAAP